MYKYERFYEMVKKWTVNDFCTPGIKAEVIIDMLLSEFIEEIVYCGLYDEQQRKDGKQYYKREDYYLLAKEFPVVKDPSSVIDSKEKNENGLRNSKIDYLLVNEKAKELYLVELKTTNGSFSSDQFKLYNSYKEKNNAEKLMTCFSMIVNQYVKEKDLSSDKNPAKLKGGKKYVTVVKNIQKLVNENDITKLRECLEERYGSYKVEVIYVSLEKLCTEDKEAYFIVLNDSKLRERLQKELKGDKKECWSLVEDMLDALTAESV